MDNNYFNSKKYMILLSLMCILFIIMTIKVFDYMPQPLDDSEINQNPLPQNFEQRYTPSYESEQQAYTENQQADDSDDDDDDDDEEDVNDNNNNRYNYDQKHKHGHIDYMPAPSSSANVDFDEIPAPKGTVEEQIDVIDTN